MPHGRTAPATFNHFDMSSKTESSAATFRIAFIVALVTFASCEDNLMKPPSNAVVRPETGLQRTIPDAVEDNVRTFYGPAVPIDQGVARAWVSVNHAGEPVSLGVNISERAAVRQPDEHREYVLYFPKAAESMPFDHVTLGWNPHGHFPPGVYDVPHFDLHFNMIDVQTRLAIPGIPPPYMDPAPDMKYIPAAYVQTPGVEPAMGAHWIDVLSSEFQPGGSFTNTLILGSFDGQVIFYEPMVTLQYLNTKPNDVRAVRQPAAYQASGYYPMQYSVRYLDSPGQFSISLDQLVYRQAE